MAFVGCPCDPAVSCAGIPLSRRINGYVARGTLFHTTRRV
jgi:hypothetical protein